MAVSLDTRRQDVRLESFLRRQLPPDVYERLSTSEGCVLFSADEKRVHRFVVLGHKQLFTTEFPPKNLKVLLNLDSIASIRMLDDLPDFLSGDEQQNTVHIQIRHKREATPTNKKRFSASLAKLKKPRDSLAVPERGGAERGVVSPSPTLRGSPRLSPQDRSPASPDVRQKSPSLVFSTWSNLEISRHTPVQDRRSPLPDRRTPDPYSRTPEPHRSRYSSSPSPVPPPSGHTAEEDESPLTSRQPEVLGGKQQRAHSRLTRTSSPQLEEMRSSSLSLQGSLRYKDKTYSQPDLFKAAALGMPHWKGVEPHRSNSSETLPTLPNSLSVQSLSSASSLGSLTGLGSLRGQEGGEGDHKEVVVTDLYILRHTTDFYHLLRVCWENARINQVLQCVTSPQVSTPPRYDRFSQQFCTLKEELLTAHKLSARAELAQELNTACQKYFVIKKMFWEDSELLDFCSRQLHSQISQSKSLKSSQLGNCIEYCIILLDLLYQMLREAHLVPKRLIQLTCNSGSPINTLTTTIAGGFPLRGEVDHTQGVEFAEKACGVMFELVEVVEQARWPLSKRSKVSISWLVDLLFKNDEIKGFFSTMFKYVSEIFSNGASEEVEAHALVTLYQLTTLLCIFLKANPLLVQFFRKHFTEEFKYYITIPKGTQALPLHLPLTRTTLEQLKACRSKIFTSK